MPFSTQSRRETRLLQEIYRDATNRPVYRMLEYCLVEYDGNPDRYIEPLPVPYVTTDEVQEPVYDGVGQIVGIEYATSRPFEVHAFNDWDAAANG